MSQPAAIPSGSLPAPRQALQVMHLVNSIVHVGAKHSLLMLKIVCLSHTSAFVFL